MFAFFGRISYSSFLPQMYQINSVFLEYFLYETKHILILSSTAKIFNAASMEKNK